MFLPLRSAQFVIDAVSVLVVAIENSSLFESIVIAVLTVVMTTAPLERSIGGANERTPYEKDQSH